MEQLRVFIDESGDEHLNIASGASKNYVLAAILIRGDVYNSVVDAADSVRRRYFQTGEMKSSGVAGNIPRRTKILDALSDLDFHVVAFCVPKGRVDNQSGLRFADSFLKYTARMLCGRLPKNQGVRIIFDAKGRSRFRSGFKAYLEKYFPQVDLFRGMEFDSVDSKSSVPIQIADIYAGSIAKFYENPASQEYSAISNFLRSKATIWEWPRGIDWGGDADLTSNEEFDAIVRRESFTRAWNFIESPSHGDEDLNLKLAFLKLLIDHETIDGGDFMHSDELSMRLKNEMGQEIDGQALRSRVVGPLRDMGILLASSSKGYRIPASVSDIQRYIELGNSQIPPALSRIKLARDALRIATAGRLDVLVSPSFRNLKAAVDSQA